MQPTRYSITLQSAPSDLLERLATVLDGQGLPTVTARQQGAAIIFEGGWSELTLRSRAADALTTVWPAWHQDATA